MQSFTLSRSLFSTITCISTSNHNVNLDPSCFLPQSSCLMSTCWNVLRPIPSLHQSRSFILCSLNPHISWHFLIPPQGKQSAPRLGQVSLQANLDALLNLACQQARNLNPITECLDRLPSTWRTFFNTILKYTKKSCAKNLQQISWEKWG